MSVTITTGDVVITPGPIEKISAGTLEKRFSGNQVVFDPSPYPGYLEVFCAYEDTVRPPHYAGRVLAHLAPADARELGETLIEWADENEGDA